MTRALADRVEPQRLRQQAGLDAGKTAGERNRLGQFATPTELAREIAGYAHRLWHGRREKVRFLDPAIGTGSFYSAVLHTFRQSKVKSATGVEIDPSFAKVARDLWGPFGLKVVEGDFTALPSPGAKDRYNLILTNPPYVRHHHLSQSQKTRLRAAAEEVLGNAVNGLAGLYCYFMILAHEWLAANAISVWLIPSEFMDVNYGKALRSYLAEMVTLLHIHRYDPGDVQFDDALVSSAVVVFKNSPPPESHTAKFSFGGSLLRPRHCTPVPLPRAKRERKWTSLALSNKSTAADEDGFRPSLGTLFTIKRGIATGANNFFILPRAEAQRKGISTRFLRPILPSPRHLQEVAIHPDSAGYPAIDSQLALVDADLPEKDIKRVCPSLFDYLQEGKKQGVDRTYLASRRTPWYRQEHRPPAPFLCTYMGRAVRNGRPFRFIWNLTEATATNVYLLLYPVGSLKMALDRDTALAETVFSLLGEIDPSDLTGEGRVYGGGLHKLEPRELGRVSAKHLLQAIGLSPARNIFGDTA